MASLGTFALFGALLMALFQVFPLRSLKKSPESAATTARLLTVLQFSFLTLALFTLIYAYAVSNFSLLNVALNSHSKLSPFYKIAGAWSNHEGSMLLWVFILGLYGVLAAYFTNIPSKKFMAGVLMIQSAIVGSFTIFLILMANPFQQVFVPFVEGQGLNPILHDPSLAFHPPLLYFGYIGFSLSFSFAIAGLLAKKIDKEWAKWLRPWVLLSWSFLTLGITLGSWWAYYELGWGGWWFWDPVENASLMPWLIGVALIHSLMVLEKQDALKIWSAFLAILTFSLCLLGSFLVRSGIVSSVHSFAYDPPRGVFIFGFIALALGFGVVLLIKRAPSLISQHPLKLFTREGAIFIQNILFILLTFFIFLGTIFPIFYEIVYGNKISVGPFYFNKTTIPLFSIILLTMLIGPYLPWKQSNIKNVLKSLIFPFVLSLAMLVFYYNQYTIIQSLILLLAFNLLFGIISTGWQHIKTKSSLSLSFYRMAVAHGGVAIMIFGMSIDSFSKEELMSSLKEGESLTFLNYDIKLLDVKYKKKKIYLSEKATLLISKNGKEISVLHPEKRIYLSDQTMTTETALYHTYFSDLYVVLGGHLPHDRWSIKLSYHPQVLWIWMGGLLMTFGGFLGIMRRNLSCVIRKEALPLITQMGALQ
jgi:cytochrome c-type biogenesis protein CcmF